MIKRTNTIKVRLNETELKKLNENVRKAGLSRESYLRMYINGYVPKANPDEVFWSMMRQFYAIGNNINQIARMANATKHIEAERYNKELEKLCGAINRIEEAVLLPEKIKHSGKWTNPN